MSSPSNELIRISVPSEPQIKISEFKLLFYKHNSLEDMKLLH